MGKTLKAFLEAVKAKGTRCARFAFAAVAALLLASVGTASATDPIVIDDYGNAAGYIEAAITALGTIAGLIMVGYFGFWLVKKAMRWANKIG